MSQQIRLSGFLVSLHSITESLLEVEYDVSHLDWNDHARLIETLEDMLSEIDRKYSVKSWLCRGRSLRGKYKRITSDQRSRKIRFSPFPSKYSNVLGRLRAYLYSLVQDYCLLIESYGVRKVYLLPKQNAPTMMEIVDKINSETLEEVRRGIEEFKDTPEFFNLCRTIVKYGLDPDRMRNISLAGRFVFDVLPVDFGYSIELDDYYSRMMREKQRKGLELLKKQIERKHREYVVKVIEDISRKIKPFVARAALGKKYRNVSKKIDNIIGICNSLGLSSVSEKLLIPLKEICNNPQKVSELSLKFFGSENLEDGIEKALKQLP